MARSLVRPCRMIYGVVSRASQEFPLGPILTLRPRRFTTAGRGPPKYFHTQTLKVLLLSRTGCHYQGVHYENGREWTDGQHPCQVRIRLLQQRARIHQTLTTSKCSHRLLLDTNENDCIFFLLFCSSPNLAPVKVLSCHGGVITIANQSCQTQCNNPLPPAPGQCCPRCPGKHFFFLNILAKKCRKVRRHVSRRYTPHINHGTWPFKAKRKRPNLMCK